MALDPDTPSLISDRRRDHADDREATVARMRVLIVDDDPRALESFEQVVTEAGGDVVATTNSGQHAIDLARIFQPDVALIDWDMPRFGGALTATLMRRYAPRVMPILLIDDSSELAGSRRRLRTISKSEDSVELRDLLERRGTPRRRTVPRAMIRETTSWPSAVGR